MPAGARSTPGAPTSASGPWPAAPSRAFPFKTGSRAPRTVADLGERALIESFTKHFARPSARLMVAAPDDDAALWRGDRFVVATTDTMVEGIDFRLEWPDFDFRRLGRRIMSINLSDLAAMGAAPRHALVSLSLRGTMPVRDVDRLYLGIGEQARRFGCPVVGGDLSETRGPITLTATLIGFVASSRRVLKRTGARPGWPIAVTGTLGGAAAGLRLLERRRTLMTARQRSWVRAQLDPQPQIAAGHALVQAGVRVGGDISDGLYREVQRLTERSSIGATIDIERLPLASGLRRAQWPLAVKDSEDFQLVCAAPALRIASAKSALKRIRQPLTVIGRIEREPGIRLVDGVRLVHLPGAGYEHFR